LTFGWRFPTHWIQHLSGVRLMLDFNFSIAIDQSIPWMWLSISMGEAVGLLSKWNWYWRWSMHWVRPEFGKIRFDVCWLEWQTYTVDPISINVSWFILSEINTLNMLAESNMVDYHWPGCFINAFGSYSTLTTRFRQRSSYATTCDWHTRTIIWNFHVSCISKTWLHNETAGFPDSQSDISVIFVTFVPWCGIELPKDKDRYTVHMQSSNVYPCSSEG